MQSKYSTRKIVSLIVIIPLGIYFGLLVLVDHVGATHQLFEYSYPPPDKEETQLSYPPPIVATPTPEILTPTLSPTPAKPKLVGEKMYPCGKEPLEQPLIDVGISWIATAERLPIANYFLSTSHFVWVPELEGCYLSVTVVNQKKWYRDHIICEY